MPLIKTDAPSYNQFQDLLTGYRITQIFFTLHKNDFFQKMGHDGINADDLCKECEWDKVTGHRFIHSLVSLGLISLENNLVKPSLFAIKYLMNGSTDHQAATFEFEKKLFESWRTLDDVLKTGRRVYATDDKSPAEYEHDMEVYLNAMDDAAKIRSAELWDIIKADKKGVMADFGAGSGVYLTSFLEKNRAWHGLFVDLPHVNQKSSKTEGLKSLSERVDYIDCNLLDSEKRISTLSDQSVDLILISNLIHCQSEWETYHIIKKAVRMLKKNGSILIHDFFKDTGWFGALYDIHMMLNTYNGRTYKVDTISQMLKEAGITYQKTANLPSRSTVITGSKTNEALLL